MSVEEPQAVKPYPCPRTKGNYTTDMTEPVALSIHTTEIDAKKAGQAQVSRTGTTALLYRLQPIEGKPSYLVSTGARLRVSERSWAEARNMTFTKLGRFHPNGCYLAVQKNMVRSAPDALHGL